MNEINSNDPLHTHVPQRTPRGSTQNNLLTEESTCVNEVLSVLSHLNAIVEDNIPNNVILFVEPSKKERLIELLTKALDIPQDSVIRNNISEVNIATSVASIVVQQKNKVNSVTGESALIIIEGYEEHLLNTLGIDLSQNKRQPHDFLQGSHNNMQEGLQSYGINKRVITLTILDATHEQGINFYDAFKDSRFQNYVACVSL